jgi:soluble lytic murein transglycosylase-like protein
MNPATLVIGIPLAIVAVLMSVQKPALAQTMAKRTVKPVAPKSAKVPEKGACPDFVVELAEKWGEVFDVPREWLCSQAFVESRNDPSRINKRTGALGLLQVMPKTALWHITKLARISNDLIRATVKKFWHGRKTDLLNPDLNVMIAAAHMKFLRGIFGNNHDLVAAAYDAGHNRILKLLHEGKPLPQQSKLYIAMVHEAKLRGYV